MSTSAVEQVRLARLLPVRRAIEWSEIERSENGSSVTWVLGDELGAPMTRRDCGVLAKDLARSIDASLDELYQLVKDRQLPLSWDEFPKPDDRIDYAYARSLHDPQGLRRDPPPGVTVFKTARLVDGVQQPKFETVLPDSIETVGERFNLERLRDLARRAGELLALWDTVTSAEPKVSVESVDPVFDADADRAVRALFGIEGSPPVRPFNGIPPTVGLILRDDPASVRGRLLRDLAEGLQRFADDFGGRPEFQSAGFGVELSADYRLLPSAVTAGLLWLFSENQTDRIPPMCRAPECSKQVVGERRSRYCSTPCAEEGKNLPKFRHQGPRGQQKPCGICGRDYRPDRLHKQHCDGCKTALATKSKSPKAGEGSGTITSGASVTSTPVD